MPDMQGFVLQCLCCDKHPAGYSLMATGGLAAQCSRLWGCPEPERLTFTFFSFFKCYSILFITPFGKFGPPNPVEATAAARAALPSPTRARWAFLCFRNPPNSDMDYMIFNVGVMWKTHPLLLLLLLLLCCCCCCCCCCCVAAAVVVVVLLLLFFFCCFSSCSCSSSSSSSSSSYYYIDRRICLNIFKSTQSAAVLKALKIAAIGCHLMCKSLPYYLHLLSRSTFILLSVQ